MQWYEGLEKPNLPSARNFDENMQCLPESLKQKPERQTVSRYLEYTEYMKVRDLQPA